MERVISHAPAHKSDGSNDFRAHGRNVTITVNRACAQDFVTAWASKAVTSKTWYRRNTARTLTAETVLGYICI